MDFTGETAGNKANGYATAAAPDVHFYDTVGAADLRLADYGAQSNGLAIAAFPDDGSNIEIRLDEPDHLDVPGVRQRRPGVVDATDQARLTAYRGATKVGQSLK